MKHFLLQSAVVIALSGCLSDQRQALAGCKIEAASLDRFDQAQRINLCMERSGYEWFMAKGCANHWVYADVSGWECWRSMRPLTRAIDAVELAIGG